MQPINLTHPRTLPLGTAWKRSARRAAGTELRNNGLCRSGSAVRLAKQSGGWGLGGWPRSSRTKDSMAGAPEVEARREGVACMTTQAAASTPFYPFYRQLVVPPIQVQLPWPCLESRRSPPRPQQQQQHHHHPWQPLPSPAIAFSSFFPASHSLSSRPLQSHARAEPCCCAPHESFSSLFPLTAVFLVLEAAAHPPLALFPRPHARCSVPF